MRTALAIFLPVFVALFSGSFFLFFPSLMSGKQWRAERDKARARRMAEHRMNARLLKLDI